MTTKRYLDVRYDVTDLDDHQIGNLALEAVVQAEDSDSHPGVEVESEVVEVEDDAPHGRVRSRWTGLRGQVAAHHPDGTVELLMDDGSTLTVDMIGRADFDWLEDQPRTLLVHLNIELPGTAPATVADVETEIRGALEVAAEGGHCPALATSEWSIALAEEV